MAKEEGSERPSPRPYIQAQVEQSSHVVGSGSKVFPCLCAPGWEGLFCIPLQMSML